MQGEFKIHGARCIAFFSFLAFFSIVISLSALTDDSSTARAVFFLIGLTSIFLVYNIYKRYVAIGSEEYMNDNNDGIYSIKTQLGKEFYKLEINTLERTIALEAKGKSKVYHFSQITDFGYEMEKRGEAVNYETAKYYIKTTDLAMPVWNLKFVPKGLLKYGNNFEDLYIKWQQIIHSILNKGAK